MKYGKCTNIDCEKYGETIELQDWEDMICQNEDCGLELIEAPAANGGHSVKKYIVLAAAVLGVGLGGFGVFKLGSGGSGTGGNSGRDSVVAKVDPFVNLSSYLKQVASPDLSEEDANRYKQDVLAMCANPNIEVRLLNREGVITERVTITVFLDRLWLLKKDDFEVQHIYPNDAGNKIATLEILEKNVG